MRAKEELDEASDRDVIYYRRWHPRIEFLTRFNGTSRVNL